MQSNPSAASKSDSAWKRTGDSSFARRVSVDEGDGSYFTPSDYSTELTATQISQVEPLATGARKIPVTSLHAVTTDYFIVAFARTALEAIAKTDANLGEPVKGDKMRELINKYSDAPAFMSYKAMTAADHLLHVGQGS